VGVAIRRGGCDVHCSRSRAARPPLAVNCSASGSPRGRGLRRVGTPRAAEGEAPAGRSASENGRGYGTLSGRRSIKRIVSIRAVGEAVFVDASHPQVDAFGDAVGRFQTDDAAPQQVCPRSRERSRYRRAVDEAIVESDVRLPLSTIGFEHRARVTGSLVDVLVSPFARG
jgi:hypothetical protein